jgi:hypothetical protein
MEEGGGRGSTLSAPSTSAPVNSAGDAAAASWAALTTACAAFSLLRKSNLAGDGGETGRVAAERGRFKILWCTAANSRAQSPVVSWRCRNWDVLHMDVRGLGFQR